MYSFSNKAATKAIVPLAAIMFMMCNCEAKDEAKDEPVDLSKIEDLFDQPIQPNPLTEDPNTVLVRVNGEEITRGEINEILDASMKQFGGQIPPGQKPRMFEAIKDRLITQKLVEAAIASAGMSVDDKELKDAMETISGRLPEGQTLETALLAAGINMDEYTKGLKQQILADKFMQEKVKDIPEATEEDAKKYYDENPERFVKPEEVTASHILITLDENATDEVKAEKKAQLEKIKAEITEGTITFADAAKKYSNDPGSADSGGSYTFTRGRMVPQFEEAAFTQEIGKIGDIIETQFGYHIIQVGERTPSTTVEFAEAAPSLQKFLTSKKKKEAVDAYIESLRNSATIENL